MGRAVSKTMIYGFKKIAYLSIPGLYRSKLAAVMVDKMLLAVAVVTAAVHVIDNTLTQKVCACQLLVVNAFTVSPFVL